MATCEDEMICDLAEVYGIYDYKALPISLVATLVTGLRENSRVVQKVSGTKTDITTMLLASAVDRLGILVWQQTRDGAKNRNRPKSILSTLSQGETQEESYNTVADFEREYQRLIGGEN